MWASTVVDTNKLTPKKREEFNKKWEELFGKINESSISESEKIIIKDELTELQKQYYSLGIDDFRGKKSDNNNTILKGGIIAIVAALIGTTPNIIQSILKTPQDTLHIVLPKIQIAHDTVYVEKSTSLKAQSPPLDSNLIDTPKTSPPQQHGR